VALELKGALGVEINIRFKDTLQPKWNSADSVSVVLQTTPPVTVASFVDTGLLNSLNTAHVAEEEPPAEAVEEAAEAEEVPQAEVAAEPEPEPTHIEEVAADSDDGPRTKINDKNLDLLLDLELEVTVRFGGRQMLLKEVLELSSGAMVELDRRVKDPIELILGGRVIARGEAVIVDGNYGIRITEVISRRQRLAQIA
jgi:flagellar motor switch protein FliN/FliY